jgi:hypothetical protein
MHCGRYFLSVYNKKFTIVLMWNKEDYRDFGVALMPSEIFMN